MIDEPKIQKNPMAARRKLFVHIRSSAKRRELAWTLDFEAWDMLSRANCYLCNSEPLNAKKITHKYYKHYDAVVYQGIDRIDPNLGYVQGNVQPCCKTCNFAKASLSLHGFIKHLAKILDHRPDLFQQRIKK